MIEEQKITTSRPAKIHDVLIWPDVNLTKEALVIARFDHNLHDLVADLFLTMNTLNAVGLAAPQIGVSKAVFVLRIEEDKPLVVVNPIVTVIGDEEFEWEEGCLSVPGYFKKGTRPKNIALRFNDLEGKEHHVNFGGLYAFAIQHEVDHLYGKCFVDELSQLRKPLIRRKIKKSKGEQNMRLTRMRLYLESEEGKQKQ